MPKELIYKEDKILQVAKEVYFMLFSLRDIMDRMAYDENFDYKTAFSKLMLEERYLDKLANVRSIIEEPFYNRKKYPDNGDYSFLEQVYEDILLRKLGTEDISNVKYKKYGL